MNSQPGLNALPALAARILITGPQGNPKPQSLDENPFRHILISAL